MRKHIVTLIGLALAALVAHAAPSWNQNEIMGTWTLDEGASEDPVRVLRGERGRGGNRRIVGSATIFGIPIGGKGPREEEEEPEEIDLGGAEHVFQAKFRLRIRREGNVTEIRYGNEPTIAYRDGVKSERDGTVAQAEWQDGTFTVEHRLPDGSVVSERYSVDARDELHWTAELTRRKGSFEVARVFYRSPAGEQ
jgi:hypothetical protein